MCVCVCVRERERERERKRERERERERASILNDTVYIKNRIAATTVKSKYILTF